MESDNRKRLKKNHCLMVRNLHFNEIQDQLYQDGVLSRDNLEKIIKEKTESEKIRHLIKILEKKSEIFDLVCGVLANAGYEYIAQSLLAADISDVPDEDLLDGSESEVSLQKRNDTILQQLVIEVAKLNSKAWSLTLDPVDGRLPWEFSFVNRCLSEFRRRLPRNSLSEIERVACLLGSDTLFCFLTEADGLELEEPRDEYTRTMRPLVKRLIREYGTDIENCVKKFDMREIKGYQTIDLLADEIFQDDLDVNWGRIITWFAFWGQFLGSVHICRENSREFNDFVEFHGKFIGFYLARRLHLWIAGAGGWLAFVEKFKEKDRVAFRFQNLLSGIIRSILHSFLHL